MNLLIIDDEYRARKGLSDQIEALFPNAFTIEHASGVKDGISKIQETAPSIVLLDINMEDGSGFDLLNEVPQRKFQLIFTTAYDEHAVKAFEEEALSYLLKPISPKKLAVAIDKAKQNLRNESSLRMLENFSVPVGLKQSDRIKIPIANGVRFIDCDEVVYVKAEGNYFRIYLESEEKFLLVSKTLRYFEAQMDKDRFMRVHKSYIINVNKIQEYSRSGGGTLTLSKEYEVPISPMYKTAFMEKVSIKV